MKRLTLATLLFAPFTLFAHGDHDHDSDVDLTAVISQAPSLGAVEIEQIGDYLVISTKDQPTHETGQFPNRKNPNAISAQSFAFKVPLHPERAERPIAYDGYLFGVALNGVPFDPGTGETWNGDRRWREEAIVASDPGKLGVDQNNAHVQPSGMYHYHGIPWGLINELRAKNPQAGKSEPLLIGWAADGYPIYYQEGIRSSWRLKEGQRDGGPGGRPNGAYTRDYEYEADSGDLDWLNGRYGSTLEYPEGIYQYYVTEEFPFVPRYFLGSPNEGFRKHHRGMAGRPR